MPHSPKINSYLADEDFFIEVGKQIDDIRGQIDYHKGKITQLEGKRKELFSQLGEKFAVRSPRLD